ncbi:3-isopropylmalate dehydratase [Verrucomicrobiota bacterium]
MTNDQTIVGKVYVLGDNIDTDQIIPAEHLNLVYTIPEERRTMGSHALSGLPDSLPRFVSEGSYTTEYPIIISGRNFGCGSSREHAPIALGAAGVKAVVAQSYARIFFRNTVATGEFFPLESDARLCDLFKTGEEAEIRLGDTGRLTHVASGESWPLRALGAVAPVIEAGGIFGFARATGLIARGTDRDDRGREDE